MMFGASHNDFKSILPGHVNVIVSLEPPVNCPHAEGSGGLVQLVNVAGRKAASDKGEHVPVGVTKLLTFCATGIWTRIKTEQTGATNWPIQAALDNRRRWIICRAKKIAG